MTNRQIAYIVFKETHPINWIMTDGAITSPPIMVHGVETTIKVYPSIYGLRVEVKPGGKFRSWNPWGWPSMMVQLFQSMEKDHRQAKKLILAEGLPIRKRKLFP